jgi:anti-sigma factor RsiW
MRLFRRKLPDVTCREFAEVITAYFDDAMRRRDRLALEAHFTACPDCARYLAQLRETMRVTGRIELERLSPGARDELMDAFAAWRQSG